MARRMAALRIEGGTPLQGTVRVAGAKNAALPIMAACLLADAPVHLHNIPRVRDVRILSRLLTNLGMEISPTGRSGWRLTTIDASPVHAGRRLVQQMRASFCVLGPLLARRGAAIVPLPGGCQIGRRPVDIHLRGLAALGADICVRRGYVIATGRRLVGRAIDLSGPQGPTVTGTANVMCAAVFASGTTVLRSAAREPEVVDLGNFLNWLGADIDGLGSSVIEIHGTGQLAPPTDTSSYKIIPDRIEAATLLAAAAVTGGHIALTGIALEHLGSVLETLQHAGALVDSSAQCVSLCMPATPRPFEIVARPYPGFPSDVQAQFVALACMAEGRSRIGDEVFPQRWRHVAELQKMGARITRHRQVAIVDGRRRTDLDVPLVGTGVVASDLRASAALVLAGLAAHGTTRVRQVEHLDRGYERLETKLAALGARIQRCRTDCERRPVPLPAPASHTHMELVSGEGDTWRHRWS